MRDKMQSQTDIKHFIIDHINISSAQIFGIKERELGEGAQALIYNHPFRNLKISYHSGYQQI